MISIDEKPRRRTAAQDESSKWKFRFADRLVVQRLLPVMDSNSLKMLFLFDVVQKTKRVRFWYLSDAEIATATGMRIKQVVRARRKLEHLALIDFRLYRTGANYRWHRMSPKDERTVIGLKHG